MTRILQVLVLAALVTACPKPPPAPTGPHPDPIACATSAVEACAPEVLPAVNECLSGSGDVVACLLGLVKPAGCVTYSVIACLVRHEGSAASAAWQANPQDTRDQWRAQRAHEFLERTGAKFNDGG